jgi:hypothetical protein
LIPGFIIRPFTHQSENGLRLAIAVKRIAPALTVVALLGVLALICGEGRPYGCGQAS